MLADLQAHSLTYRIALGPHRGCKAFTLQTVPATDSEDSTLLARAGGFSLHAGRVIEADQREKLEPLCRYIARPPLALERLSLTPAGTLRYRLKNPWKKHLADADLIAMTGEAASPWLGLAQINMLIGLAPIRQNLVRDIVVARFMCGQGLRRIIESMQLVLRLRCRPDVTTRLPGANGALREHGRPTQ